MITNPKWAFGALGCGVLFNIVSATIGFRQFEKQSAGKRFWEAVHEIKDPSTLMVVFEDTADILGELIAAAGVGAQLLGWVRGDGAASVLVGVLLGVTSVFLIAQNRDLIIGEGVEDEISRSIREIATSKGGFEAIRSARTMYFGPDNVLVTMDALFDPERKAGDLMKAMDQIQREICEKYPAVKYIYIDPESAQNYRAEIRKKDLPRAS